MPMATAKRLCPDAVIIPGDIPRYAAVSRQIHAIFRDVTPLVEPLAFDEAFLDVTGARGLFGTPKEMGTAIRSRIAEDLELGCAVGVGNSKMIAKLASKQSKPRVEGGSLVEGDGVVWVSPELERRWLAELPVRALWGVGPQTAAKLHQLGLRWVRDLAKVDESTLASQLGSAMAATLVAYARGEDDRSVVSHRELKSLGHDETFAVSLGTLEQVLDQGRHPAGIVARALRGQDRVARTVSVVLRFDDLVSISRSQTLPFGVDDEAALCAVAQALVRSVDLNRPVRLLGLYASSFLDRDHNPVQLSFDVATHGDDKVEAVERSRERQVSAASLRDALDDIRRRYGEQSVGVAAQLAAGGLRVERQRGSHAFGPETPTDD